MNYSGTIAPARHPSPEATTNGLIGASHEVSTSWRPLFRRVFATSPHSCATVSSESSELGFCSAGEALETGGSWVWADARRARGTGSALLLLVGLGGRAVLERPEGDSRVLLPGTAIATMLRPVSRLSVPADAPGCSFLWLHVAHPYAVERLRVLARAGFAAQRLDPTSELATTLDRLVTGERRGTFRDRLEAELVLFAFVFALERTWWSRTSEPTDDGLLKAIRAWVLSNPRREWNVEQLAAERGLSRAHFSRVFRARTGLTPARFVSEIRVREAARLLCETTMPMKQVAYELGFSTFGHFCRVFRRFQGTSPGAYRRAPT